MLSARLIEAVRKSPVRQYRLARQIEVNPGTLSAWIVGIYDPRPGDPRVLKLGEILGVPVDECFGPPAVQGQGADPVATNSEAL